MDHHVSLHLWRRKVVRRGLTYSLLLVVLIFVFGGLGFWVLEPTVHTLSDGLWLSFTTAATVGYGDMVPSTTMSRAFAVMVVLLGLAVLSLVTASLAAIFVEKDVVDEERRIDAELLREIRHLRDEVQSLREQLAAPPRSGS
ncbi:MAG: ion channel [Burkholderiaceae bacterium]